MLLEVSCRCSLHRSAFRRRRELQNVVEKKASTEQRHRPGNAAPGGQGGEGLVSRIVSRMTLAESGRNRGGVGQWAFLTDDEAGSGPAVGLAGEGRVAETRQCGSAVSMRFLSGVIMADFLSWLKSRVHKESHVLDLHVSLSSTLPKEPPYNTT